MTQSSNHKWLMRDETTGNQSFLIVKDVEAFRDAVIECMLFSRTDGMDSAIANMMDSVEFGNVNICDDGQTILWKNGDFH